MKVELGQRVTFKRHYAAYTDEDGDRHVSSYGLHDEQEGLVIGLTTLTERLDSEGIGTPGTRHRFVAVRGHLRGPMYRVRREDLMLVSTPSEEQDDE